MVKNKDKVFSKVAETAKESDMMRMRRIDGSQNGATLRTRVVRDKTKYNRNLKHKKYLSDARDFPFLGGNLGLNAFDVLSPIVESVIY